MAENFDKQIIGSVVDVYNSIDNDVNIMLYTPTFKLVGIIEPCFNRQCSLKFNDKSELSFSVPYQYTDNFGNTITTPIYSQIERTMLLRIPKMGWWYIDSVAHQNDGVEHSLNVTAYSYEHTLTLRSVNLYTNRQSDENTMVLNLYGIMTEFKKQTGWALPQGYYDNPSAYMQTNKMFTIELNTSWYEFMRNAVQEAFDCFVFFDYENLAIDIKLSYSQVYLRKSNIVLSFDNLLKDISIEESSQRQATALYVKGNDCNIIDVNPLGTSIIYNFTPYLTTKWMSQSTITAITTWQSKIRSYEEVYRNLTGFRNFLIDFRRAIETQRVEFENKMKEEITVLTVDDTAPLDLNGKHGDNYKFYGGAAADCRDIVEWIEGALNILQSVSTETDGCYSALAHNVDVIPRCSLIGIYNGESGLYMQDKWENYDVDTGSIGWKQYKYLSGRFEEIIDTYNGELCVNIFKLNNNQYGAGLLSYYNTNSKIPTIADIVADLSWGNNFTQSQLKEIGKYIIDASYHADELSYYTGDGYTNLLNPFDLQYGSLIGSPQSNPPNPNDAYIVETPVGRWTTGFIKLPEKKSGLSLRFFDKETGNVIVPYRVMLYDSSKTATAYFDETAVQGKTSWDEESGKPTVDKAVYMRATFVYYLYIDNQIQVQNPFFRIACTLGTTYKDIVVTNSNNALSLKQQAEEKHKELCQPCKSFAINVANFLKLSEYSVFARDLSLGANVKAEVYPNQYEDVRLLEMSFSFDDIDSLSMTFGNKYGVNSDRIMFRRLVSSNGDTFDIQDSFTSFDYDNNTLR